MRWRRFELLAACVALSVASGCIAILGIEDRPLRDDGVSADPRDGATDIEASSALDAEGPSPYVAAVLADEPLAYFRFEEDPRTTLDLKDERNELIATYPASGVTSVAGALTGAPNGAVHFDGTSHITVKASDKVEFEGKAKFSVEAWVRAGPGLAPYTWVIDHEIFEPRREGWGLPVGSEGVFFERFANGTGASTATKPLTVDVWTHLVAVYDGFYQHLYVNGAPSGMTETTRDVRAIAGDFSIGDQNCECSGGNFIGDVDELAIYDKALEAAQVLRHYRAGRPPS